MNNGEPTSDRASFLSLRWISVAVVSMELLYVLVMNISDIALGINTPHKLFTLSVALVSVILLSSAGSISLVLGKHNRFLAAGVILINYLSVTMFAVYNTTIYRDGIIALLWTILLATTGILYGNLAFSLGLTMMVGSTLFCSIFIDHQLNRSISTIIIMMPIAYASYLFYKYKKVGLIEVRNYNRLKRRERLQTRRLKVVVNNLRDALVSVSSEGKIQLYNPATLSLLDTNRNLTGISADRVFNLVDEMGEPIKLSAVIANIKIATERTDLRMQYSDKQLINLRMSIFPIKNQFAIRKSRNIDGVIIVMTDITKEKSLDDERDEFISVVSHELRTPVAIAEGALSNMQLLLDRGGDPRVFTQTLDSAHNQILYLGQMVNDLATLSRAERGIYMDNEEIDIESFMTSLYNKYAKPAKEKGLRFIVDIDLTGKVLVPSMVIEEIMQNLISNAIKYTEVGSVTVGVRAEPHDRSHARFYVRDTGIGISKSDLDKIYLRFWRSEDYRTRQTSGTGLGLHVVDRLASKVGTHIDVKSELNIGSTFSLLLPVKRDKK